MKSISFFQVSGRTAHWHSAWQRFWSSLHQLSYQSGRFYKPCDSTWQARVQNTHGKLPLANVNLKTVSLVTTLPFIADMIWRMYSLWKIKILCILYTPLIDVNWKMPFSLLSFFTPYWLQSFPSPKLPSPKFTNLGKPQTLLLSFVVSFSISNHQ